MHQELSTRVGDLSGPQLTVFLAASIKLIDLQLSDGILRNPPKKEKKKKEQEEADIITFKTVLKHVEKLRYTCPKQQQQQLCRYRVWRVWTLETHSEQCFDEVVAIT